MMSWLVGGGSISIHSSMESDLTTVCLLFLLQARWVDEDALFLLPHVDESVILQIHSLGISNLPALVEAINMSKVRPG